MIGNQYILKKLRSTIVNQYDENAMIVYQNISDGNNQVI